MKTTSVLLRKAFDQVQKYGLILLIFMAFANSASANGNCQANFFWYPDSSGSTCSIYFMNNSVPYNLNYHWSFGDGTSSTQMNPVHKYANAGTYTACLTVYDSLGSCYDSICQIVTAVCGSNNNCNADFNAYVDSIKGCSVYLSNLSQPYNANFYYDWDFGDGTSSNQKNPVHTYAQSGTYTIILYIQDINGICDDTTSKTVTVNCGSNSKCYANFTAHEDSLKGCGVYFSNTTWPNNGNFYFQWNFGDGTSSNQKNPYHFYANSGTYSVMLYIADLNGNCTDSIFKNVTVNCGSNSNCQANFNAYVDSLKGCTVYFSNTSLPYNASFHYDWSFGDGTYSFQKNPVHQYKNAGTYWACLSVYDSLGGCFDSICKPVTVNCGTGSSCEANFTYKDSGCTVYFNNTSQGSYLYYKWTFGDGSGSTLKHPYHQYAQSGTYKVMLYVYNQQQNCTDTIYKTISVNCGSNNYCNANFTYQDSGCTVYFNNTSQGSYLLYQWNFGDGSHSALKNPYHQYAQSGTYKVMLYIYNQKKTCTDTIYKQVTVNCGSNSICNANFSSQVNGQFAYLNNTSTGNTYSVWSFGDGSISMQNNAVSHYYSAPGTYKVCLTIINCENACKDSICQTITIGGGNGSKCNASFDVALYVDSLGGVIFNNTSTGGSSYEWYFGDGTSSTKMNPYHQYKNSGQYQVCLYVFDANKALCDSTCKMVNISLGQGNNTNVNENSDISKQLKSFPNPFSGVTTIAFNLTEKSTVSIEIYDMLGNLVKVLNKGQLEAGSYSEEWNAAENSSGIYLLKYSINGNASTQKLILNK